MKTLLLALQAFALVLTFGFSALADHHEKGKAPTVQEEIEHHQHVADLHSKAAECLKGGKTQQECHDAMMAQCKEHCKDHCKGMAHMDGCPMEHKHGGKSGKMKKGA